MNKMTKPDNSTPAAAGGGRAPLDDLADRIDAYFKKPNLWYENKSEANALLRAVLAAVTAQRAAPPPQPEVEFRIEGHWPMLVAMAVRELRFAGSTLVADKIAALAKGLRAAAPAEGAGWQPIETAPKDETALFWVVSKTSDEAYVNTSGQPIFSTAPPRVHLGNYGTWSSLSKATHWQPLPAPPMVSRRCSSGST